MIASKKTPSAIIGPVLEELRIWRELVTKVMWGGDKPHALFLSEGHIPDSVLEQLAKNVTSVVAPKEEKDRKTAGEVSNWYGMKVWESREPLLKNFLIRGWEKGMHLVNEENKKKKEVQKKERAARHLKNKSNYDIAKLPSKTAKPIGPPRLQLGSVSRRGSKSSIESMEAISNIVLNSHAASAASAATMTAEILLQGKFRRIKVSHRVPSTPFNIYYF